MYTLSNDHLSVMVLDPLNDIGHLGSRYCTGGYIWQIEDKKRGLLLSGPHFPVPSPLPFDGQGAPEAFVMPLETDDPALGTTVTILGVGSVLRTSDKTPFHVRDNPMVQEFCSWKIAIAPHRLCMSTVHQSDAFCVLLQRNVELDRHTIVSRTEIVNRSPQELPIRWFAHPFFPLNRDLWCCRMNFPWSVPENPGYIKNSDGVLCMKNDYAWEKGLFLKLDIRDGSFFSASAVHPLVGSVGIVTDYPLESLPVWANARTFSPEPYLSRSIAPGERTAWTVSYTMGEDADSDTFK
jgi:hypothetical protein